MSKRKALALAVSVLLASGGIASAAGSGGSSAGTTSSTAGTSQRGGSIRNMKSGPAAPGKPGVGQLGNSPAGGGIPPNSNLPAGGVSSGLPSSGGAIGSSGPGTGSPNTLGPGVTEIPDMGIGGPAAPGTSTSGVSTGVPGAGPAIPSNSTSTAVGGLPNAGSLNTLGAPNGTTSVLGPGITEIPDMGIGGPPGTGIRMSTSGPGSGIPSSASTNPGVQGFSGATPGMTPLKTPSPQSIAPQ